MKPTKIIMAVLLSVVVVLVFMYGYYGGFKTVKFQVAEQGGEILVYREFTGDYQKSGEKMDEIYSSLLNDYKIVTTKGFGIYYDNPDKVAKNKLRSDIGCILENADTAKMEALEKKYKIKICPKRSYLVTEFPFNGKLSIIIGILKVYPTLDKYQLANGYSNQVPVMEIYDQPNKKIIYRAEAVKNQ